MIKFGWRVPDFPVDGSSPVAFRDQQFAFLEEFQEHFDSAWVADHFVPWMASWDQTTPAFECFTTLTYLCAKYTHLTFGSIVMSQSYRPPALLAKMAAMLQVLSGGRFILGIGAGWKVDEYLAYGYEFPSAAARIHQLAEAVQIIRSMWTQPRATFHGQYYHIDNAICEPKPDPLPPIMIGGSGRKLTLRVVAQHADWWNGVGCSPEEMRDALTALTGHCQAVGRDPSSIVKTFSTDCVTVVHSSQEAQRMAKASPYYSASAALVGTPDEVAAQMQKYINLGVEHFMLRFVDFPRFECAKLFIDEVLPRFR
jgi:alkanesulfonate monooxygenase SsuD/methylene tetrahydromethanopterin reductase-like flavin-dependent oxidoreductase (luciferase family)